MSMNGKEINLEKYLKMTGSPQLLARRTRPDIMLSPNTLAQYSAKKTSFLMRTMKCVIGYLKLRMVFAIKFRLENAIKDLKALYTDFYFGKVRKELFLGSG